ncbi:unnamed protein product [Linum trigynum]|uniref:Uncharacterized protein n=1 Tax=Linum trigynum TaxID=586398 RepID=A0AAV2EEL3_9ROSI
MSSSKFFDPEWVHLSQLLQQSLDRYEREERERAKGAATDGKATSRPRAKRSSGDELGQPWQPRRKLDRSALT